MSHVHRPLQPQAPLPEHTSPLSRFTQSLWSHSQAEPKKLSWQLHTPHIQVPRALHCWLVLPSLATKRNNNMLPSNNHHFLLHPLSHCFVSLFYLLLFFQTNLRASYVHSLIDSITLATLTKATRKNKNKSNSE